MIAVIFEVWPKPDRKQEYLRIAAELKPLLEEIDGFISIERFESLYEPGKLIDEQPGRLVPNLHINNSIGDRLKFPNRLPKLFALPCVFDAAFELASHRS